ncbi:MAG: M48 family metallopeptidase [Clostridiaceae bacterium]|nr:M48 family metallopeptidase [Clostridiaceae bacterium]
MDYELIRSGRRTIAVQVGEAGHVTVRAPLRMPTREIDAFVTAHAEWIRRHREQRRSREAAAQTIALTPKLTACLKEQGKQALPKLVWKWAELLGVTPAGITLTNAATRWGSCGANGRICLSVRALLLPERCLEYIVVHELAHLKEHNHSARFYAVVERVMPDWRERFAQIREFERTHRVTSVYKRAE